MQIINEKWEAVGLKKFVASFIILVSMILLFGGYTVKIQKEPEKENQKPKETIDYALEFNDHRFMTFKIKNHSDMDIELVWPTTHTFDFRLIKDGIIIWDSYKDDKTLIEQNWVTHQLLKANGEVSIDIWYANISKDLSGKFNYEFYATCDQLKAVTHLIGTLDLESGKTDVNRIRVVK